MKPAMMYSSSSDECSDIVSSTSSDECSDIDGDLDEQRELCALQPSYLHNRKAFSDKQTTCPTDHFRRGMIGVGRRYSALIEAASLEAGLTTEQVKGWIKRTLFCKRHADPITSESLPTKKVKISPWQQFQREFAATDEGKEAFAESPANFQKVTSEAYKCLEDGDRNRLQSIAKNVKVKWMTSRDVRREGGRIFQSMQKKFQELKELGYHAFAFGIYGDGLELVGTPFALKCCTPQILQYLSAVLTAGNPPIIGTSEPTSKSSSKSSETTSKQSSKSSTTTPKPSTTTSKSSSKSSETTSKSSEPTSKQSSSKPSTTTFKPSSKSTSKPSSKSSTTTSNSDPGDTWLIELFSLTLHDKSTVVNPQGWLNDAIINAAQVLLKRQSGVSGFQNTQYGKVYKFQQEAGDFVQVFHVSRNHWITISNIGCQSNTVNVFDSALATIDMDGTKQVCSVMKLTGDTLVMAFINIQH